MPKTITLRVPDDTYTLLKRAAEGEKRTLSNYIEFAALAHITESGFAGDGEMQELLQDKELLKNLKQGRRDVKNGKYRIV